MKGCACVCSLGKHSVWEIALINGGSQLAIVDLQSVNVGISLGSRSGTQQDRSCHFKGLQNPNHEQGKYFGAISLSTYAVAP